MTIVVGYDGRREGRDALALAAALGPVLRDNLLVASVCPSPESSFGPTAELLHLQGERMAAEGVGELPEGVEATPVGVPGLPRGSTGSSSPSTPAWRWSARAIADRSEACSPDESPHGC